MDGWDQIGSSKVVGRKKVLMKNFHLSSFDGALLIRPPAKSSHRLEAFRK